MNDNFLLLLGIGALLWAISRSTANATTQQNVFDVFQKGAANALTTVESSLSLWKYDPRGNKYDQAFFDAEVNNGLPEYMLRRIAWQESRFNPDAISPAGAIGLMQFMPATAASLGFDPHDPFASITGAAKYLSGLYRMTGSWTNALAAYNWGIGNLKMYGLSSAPAETQQYVASITSDLNIS